MIEDGSVNIIIIIIIYIKLIRIFIKILIYLKNIAVLTIINN